MEVKNDPDLHAAAVADVKRRAAAEKCKLSNSGDVPEVLQRK